MSSPCKMAHGHSHQHGHHHHPSPPANSKEDKEVARQQEDEDYSNWDIVKATQHGLLDRCMELVDAGYDVRQPDNENVTLLHWAAINNRQDLVRYFISKGAVVDQLGGTLNSTPLQWAIRQGHLQMVILLLRCGADPNLIDGEGYCSIHLAVLFQHLPIIAYLIAKGQSIDTADMNGMTPLMLSANRIIGMEPTSFILKLNPSVHAVDKIERNTALHWAVKSGNVNAVDLLLEAGSSLDTQNGKGETPLDIARQTRNRLATHILMNEMQAKSARSYRLLKSLHKYEISLIALVIVSIIGAIGYILDLDTDSWLLKGMLLALVTAGSQLFTRRFVDDRSQKYLPAIFFMSSLFWAFMTWFVCFLPNGAHSTIQIPFFLSMLSLLYFFYKTWRSDPGYIKSSEQETKQTIISLAEAGCLDPRMFCSSCLVKKPLRSMHCHACNCCVARFDQHCIWIGQCIGAGNHCYFLPFLASLLVVGHWMIGATSVYWAEQCTTTIQKDGLWDFLGEVIICSPWILYIFLIICSFTIWASLMLIVQIYQIAFLGLTTQERISLQVQNRHSQHQVSLRKTPFNRGCMQNLSDFFRCRCFGLIKHDPVDWTKQFHGVFHASMMRNAHTV
ncbi:palmitoyltransferase ZDHHC13 [Pelobates fuscus]|uniref:palmitoyltransferase ZDHHC13 n=1 Tax=Pelobates fuscus TaxID=191477 RepID=UPI002FE48095